MCATPILRRLLRNKVYTDDWHLDGAFLGACTKVVNVWLALPFDCLCPHGTPINPVYHEERRAFETGLIAPSTCLHDFDGRSNHAQP
jgi:hypothetical protein